MEILMKRITIILDWDWYFDWMIIPTILIGSRKYGSFGIGFLWLKWKLQFIYRTPI